MKRILSAIAVLSVLACSGQKQLADNSATPVAVMIKEAPAHPMGPCEPSIAINLKDPSMLVAGSILDRVYYSNDSGKTWVTGDLSSSMGVWGDPVVESDTNGRFLFFHLSDPDGRNWAGDSILDRIVCQWSDDGGKTWSDGSYMGMSHPKDQDKEWSAVDLRTNAIYCTWTQFDSYGSADTSETSNILFARSDNGGESWSEAVRINEQSGDCLDDDNTTEGAVPAVGPEGEIYVAWALDENIWFDRSLDGGQTWMDSDIKVADQPGGWTVNVPGLNRSNGMPVTAADVSGGPHNGNVYVCWADTRNGEDDMDIWMARSTDHGTTWSEHIRINQDEGSSMQFLPWMVTDPVTGKIHVVFYDRRNHDNAKTDVMVATSEDGGDTWTEVRVNKESFMPIPIVFFGDYNDIAAYDGMVRPIWTEFRDGKLQVWTALLQY